MIYSFGPKHLPRHDHHLAAALCNKHEELGWPGLLGSLDCSHWIWAKCPTSLQGEFKKGSKERPTVVYECACDSDLFIWHCFFALPGACSDINVLDVSPLLFSIASGKTMTEFRLNGCLLYQPYVVHLYCHATQCLIVVLVTFLWTVFIRSGHAFWGPLVNQKQQAKDTTLICKRLEGKTSNVHSGHSS